MGPGGGSRSGSDTGPGASQMILKIDPDPRFKALFGMIGRGVLLAQREEEKALAAWEDDGGPTEPMLDWTR